MEISREHIQWGCRLFLDREADEASLNIPFADTRQLRRHFLNSQEFRLIDNVGHASGRTWVIYETRHNFRIYLTLEDFDIARNIILGRYEISETEFVKSEIKPGDLVVDVGANIGYYSLLFGTLVAPHGRVISFEPIPFLFEALEKSVVENRFGALCELHETAISDIEGHAVLRYADNTDNFGGAYMVSDSTVTPNGAVDIVARTERLTKFISTFERCSFLKVDVEGAEPAVLRSAAEVLARDRPTIMCELHNAQLSRVSGVTATEVIGQMADLGYRCRAIEDGSRGSELKDYLHMEPLNVVFDAQS